MTFLFAVLAAAGLLYAIWPVLSDLTAPSTSAPKAERTENTILFQIEDLDLEFAAGKIPEEAYRKIRDELVIDAARTLKNANGASHV